MFYTESGGDGYMECMVKVWLVVAALAVTCCSFCGLKKWAKNFNIRNYCCFRKLFKKMGIDTYDTFEMQAIMRKANFAADSDCRLCLVIIISGKQSIRSKNFRNGDQVHQTLPVTVEQGVRQILLELHDDAGHCVARRKMTVEEVLQLADKDESTKRALVLRKRGTFLSTDAQVYIDFVTKGGGNDLEGMEGIEISNLSPEMQLSLQKANKTKQLKKQRKRTPRQKKSESSDDSEGDTGESSPATGTAAQLDLIAKTCCGPLKLGGSFGHKTNYYFAVYQGAQDGTPNRYSPDSKFAQISWSLGWWKDQENFVNGEKPIGAISMLRVTNIFLAPDSPNVFCIRHISKAKGKEEMFLDRVDRSRDVWVESLHLFIEHLRQARTEAATSRGLERHHKESASSEGSASKALEKHHHHHHHKNPVSESRSH
eukprot:gnl/MRDRNA2_/MRDRNA2_36356_c0_seq1.p1 gnl/MRDRNA2_/MRDRNA2_36356_c0~~gnl/MRDRNA2_/MRDRNA2_36356_c0_seq1.p1  ORF type:complete len:427 (+),score=83.54 gnl/MRDRNA2_/MRDRNA2_36356_c0_seq1:106-1386(+)